MKKILCRLICAFVFVGAVATASDAQSDKPAVLKEVKVAKPFPLPIAKRFVVQVAKLLRVDEGVFELEIGKAIDLTDRKILLSIRLSSSHRKECCQITLNGERASWRAVGSRIDLKRERGTSKYVEDKDLCYIDVIDVARPKGARGIATFRLHCI